MLNTAENEICPANKSQITTCNNCILFFLAKYSWDENFCANKYENANYYWADKNVL